MPDECEIARSSATEPRAISHSESDLLNRVGDLAGAELDSADLPLPDGRVVRVVALDEVEQWLHGLATRGRSGRPL